MAIAGVWASMGLALLVLLYFVMKLTEKSGESEQKLKQATDTMDKNRQDFKNAERIYTKPRPLIDDAIDGL